MGLAAPEKTPPVGLPATKTTTMRWLIRKDDGTSVSVGKALLLGRDAECDLRLDTPDASQRHARVVLVGRQTFVEDLESTAGVLLNGKPVLRSPLSHGDLVTVAGVEFLYQEEHEEPAPGDTREISVADSSRKKTPARRIRIADEVLDAPGQKPKRRTSSIRLKMPSELCEQVAEPAKPSHTDSSARLRVSSALASDSERLRVLQAQALRRAQQTPPPSLTQSWPALARAMTAAGVLVLAGLLYVAGSWAWPHFKAWREQSAQAEAGDAARREALARLAQPGPKCPADLPYLRDPMRKAEGWNDIKALLGAPHEERSGKVLLYTPSRGSFEQVGHAFKIYFIEGEGIADYATYPTVDALLFEVLESGSVRYHGPVVLARKQFDSISVIESTPSEEELELLEQGMEPPAP